MSVRAASQSKEKIKSEKVSIGAKLRKAHPWFEAVAETAKNAALEERRRKNRTQGCQLPGEQLEALADELEEIQKELNPLENCREEKIKFVLAHWGYTGIREIEAKLGQTLISPSFELCVDPDIIKDSVGDILWRKMTKRTLEPKLFLAQGDSSKEIRKAAAAATRVRRLRISVTSPSSRRPRSGEPEEEDG